MSDFDFFFLLLIGYVHRDVRPENLIFGLEDKHCLYLVDFGLVKKIEETEGRIGFAGTLNFASTNVHQSKCKKNIFFYNKALDY